jgi:cell division protein FtsZ
MLNYEPTKDNRARIVAVGVGGAGCRVLDHLIESGAPDIQFVAADTDFHDLDAGRSSTKLLLGENTKRRTFCRMTPEWARKAALDDEAMLKGALQGADLVFVVAGLGGGCATGAAPVVVEVAREVGAVSIAVVSTPFAFEGESRAAQAERGLKEIERLADITVLIPYYRLRLLIAPKTKVREVWAFASEVMGCGVRGITELIRGGEGAILDGDFESLRPLLVGCGRASMAFGRGESLMQAMESALSSPLLEEGVLGRARKVILCPGASNETTIEDVQDAIKLLQTRLRDDVDVIRGVVMVEGEPRVTLYATALS